MTFKEFRAQHSPDTKVSICVSSEPDNSKWIDYCGTLESIPVKFDHLECLDPLFSKSNNLWVIDLI